MIDRMIPEIGKNVNKILDYFDFRLFWVIREYSTSLVGAKNSGLKIGTVQRGAAKCIRVKQNGSFEARVYCRKATSDIPHLGRGPNGGPGWPAVGSRQPKAGHSHPSNEGLVPLEATMPLSGIGSLGAQASRR